MSVDSPKDSSETAVKLSRHDLTTKVWETQGILAYLNHTSDALATSPPNDMAAFGLALIIGSTEKRLKAVHDGL